jgi:polar amino acid transport system substrate-binding protein
MSVPQAGQHRVSSTHKLLLLCMVPLAMLLDACGDKAAPVAAKSTLERAREAGKIRVGYANEAPYAWLDSKSGRLTGEAPEIARAVLADMGIREIEGVLTEFGSLIPGLNAGRFDIIAAGMYVLPERCKEVAFSNPTYSVGEALIVAPGNPAKLHSYQDVATSPDARLGVVAGTVEHGYAKAAGVPQERVIVFPDAPSALEGVVAGRVEAFGATSLTANDMLARMQDGRAERATPFSDPVIEGKTARGYGAFAFRKEDKALLAAFNAELARLIGTPRHLEMIKAFGFTKAELPGSVTADSLCNG